MMNFFQGLGRVALFLFGVILLSNDKEKMVRNRLQK